MLTAPDVIHLTSTDGAGKDGIDYYQQKLKLNFFYYSHIISMIDAVRWVYKLATTHYALPLQKRRKNRKPLVSCYRLCCVLDIENDLLIAV